MSAQDSSSSRIWPFRGAHFDAGGGSLPYLDTHGPASAATEVKITLPLRRFPAWSISFAVSTVVDTDTTSYVVTRVPWSVSNPLHPELISTAVAFELQHRWDEDRQVHPMGTVSAGVLMNTYSYYESVGRGEILRELEKRWKGCGHVAGGAEANIRSWLRVNALLGYRSGGRMTIPSGKGANGGMTTMFNLQLGKF